MSKNKEVILITGAGRGIGAAIAGRISNKDRIIYINDVSNPAEAGGVLDSVKQKGGEALTKATA